LFKLKLTTVVVVALALALEAIMLYRVCLKNTATPNMLLCLLHWNFIPSCSWHY